MSKARFSKQYILALAAITAISGGAAHAATIGTWKGLTDANWSTAANWSAVPGATTGTTNGDTALFNTNPTFGTTGNPLVVDSGRNVENLSFDTAAGNYVIGTSGNTLLLTSGGTTQILATLTSTGVTETVNAALTLEPASATAAGSYTFANNAADPTSTLVFGGAISGGTTSNTETLTLNGSNTGANSITGAITNGGATTFAITKSGAGTWNISGAIASNGAITTSAGILNISNTVSAAPITVSGGTVNLSGLDTGSGAISISAGALNISNTVSVAAMTASGGTLTLTGLDTGNGAITVSGGTFNAENTISGTEAIAVSAGTFNLSGTDSGTGTITVSATGQANISGAITNTAAITVTTGGIVNITGTDSGSGAVTLTSGAINVTSTLAGPSLGTGAITINNGALAAAAPAAGTYTLGTGNFALNSVLSLSASAGNAVNYTAANVTATSTKLTFGLVGGNTDTLALNANGGTLSFTVGNAGNTSGVALARGTGGVLIIAPSAVANLGASEQFFVTGQAATTGTIYGPYVMVVDTPANNSVADFVTYTGATNGFQAASLAGVEVNQSATSLDTENSPTVVFNDDTPLTTVTLTGNRQVYALRTAGSIDPGANTLTIGNGTTSAPAGLILNGSGISIGSVANTGSLIFGTATAPGDGIIYTAQTATINTNITANGGLTFAGPGDLTINGDIALGTSASYWNNPGNLVINGQLSSTSAAASIHYMGAGNLDLTADNSAFTGTFVVGPASITGTAPLGTLTINNSNALGSGPIQFNMGSAAAHTTLNVANDVTLANLTSISVNGGYAAFSGTGNLTLNGVLTNSTNTTIENDMPAGKAITYAGGLSLTSGQTLTVTGAGENIVSGPISGAGNLNYVGSGDFTISDANTSFSGTFILGGFSFPNNATVTIGNPAGFGTGTLDIFSATVATGPFLSLQAASDMSIANNVVLGTATSGSRRVSVFGGTHSMNFTGSISLGTNQTVVINNVASPASLTFSGPSFALGASPYTFTITGTGDTFISAPISGGAPGPFNFVYSSTGTLTLSGANTLNGPLDFYSGTVSVASINSVTGTTPLNPTSNLGAPNSVANGTIAMGSGTSSATLLYTGPGESTNRIINLAGTTGGATIDQSGTGTLEFTSAFTATGGGIKTLTLQGSTAGTGAITAAIVNNSATNTTSLVKTGTGTWTLSGTNTYTGGTTITGGTLVAGASQALGLGNVTVSGGTLELDPAVNIGAGDFDLASGTLKLDLGTDSTNALAGTGTSTYTLGAGTTVDLGIGAASFNYGIDYDILTFKSGSVGDISITDYDTADWLAAIADNGSGTAVLSFTPAAVPEPASLALLGLGGVGLLMRRRRRVAAD